MLPQSVETFTHFERGADPPYRHSLFGGKIYYPFRWFMSEGQKCMSPSTGQDYQRRGIRNWLTIRRENRIGWQKFKLKVKLRDFYCNPSIISALRFVVVDHESINDILWRARGPTELPVWYIGFFGPLYMRSILNYYNSHGNCGYFVRRALCCVKVSQSDGTIVQVDRIVPLTGADCRGDRRIIANWVISLICLIMSCILINYRWCSISTFTGY